MLSFYWNDFGFPRAKQGLCHTKHGGAGGIIFVNIAYSISSFMVYFMKSIFNSDFFVKVFHIFIKHVLSLNL